MSFKSKYSSSEVESLLDKVNGMGDTEITKEQVESVLTGNITTHRHDTTYNYTDFETDVWDGTSISTSLQGSGTKEDPYMIQSCADWLHLFVNGLSQYNKWGNESISNVTEFSPVFKLNKNLDFGNKTIPDVNIGTDNYSLGYYCEFDGNGAKISNFKTVKKEGDGSYTTGVFPGIYGSFVHDFVIENATFNTVFSSGDFYFVPIYSIAAYDINTISSNNIIKGSLEISGNVQDEKQLLVYSIPSAFSTQYNSEGISSYLQNYIEEHGCFIGLDIDVVDNTEKGSGSQVAFMNNIQSKINQLIYDTKPLTDIELTETGITSDSDFIYATSVIEKPSNIYTNSEGSNKYINATAEALEYGTPKSLTEMQSAAFVEELNSKLPKPAFKQDPNGGTPILIQGNQVIDYDGYVKQSVFNTTVEEINNSIAGNKTVVFSDVNFFQEKTTGSQQQKFFVEDNFIEELGGLEKAKELFELILDQSKIIRGMMFAYVIPYIYDITSKILFNQTKSNTVVPEDGDSFYMQLGAYVAMGTSSANEIPYSLTTTVTVTNFNKENMTVKIDRSTKCLVSSDGVSNILEKTQTEYDSLETKDSKTLYLITE